MSMICSNSDWNNSRCGCFGSLFGRIVFPSFSSNGCFLWGILNPISPRFTSFYAAFTGFSGSTNLAFKVGMGQRPATTKELSAEVSELTALFSCCVETRKRCPYSSFSIHGTIFSEICQEKVKTRMSSSGTPIGKARSREGPKNLTSSEARACDQHRKRALLRCLHPLRLH